MCAAEMIFLAFAKMENVAQISASRMPVGSIFFTKEDLRFLLFSLSNVKQ